MNGETAACRTVNVVHMGVGVGTGVKGTGVDRAWIWRRLLSDALPLAAQADAANDHGTLPLQNATTKSMPVG